MYSLLIEMLTIICGVEPSSVRYNAPFVGGQDRKWRLNYGLTVYLTVSKPVPGQVIYTVTMFWRDAFGLPQEACLLREEVFVEMQVRTAFEAIPRQLERCKQQKQDEIY